MNKVIIALVVVSFIHRGYNFTVFIPMKQGIKK